MVVLKELETTSGDLGGWVFTCPGCKKEHWYDTRWKFDGNFEKPSFSPSLLVYPNKTAKQPRCHLWITNGIIRFFDDCDHELKNQTVPMVELLDW
jgi:hypothetical protein